MNSKGDPRSRRGSFGNDSKEERQKSATIRSREEVVVVVVVVVVVAIAVGHHRHSSFPSHRLDVPLSRRPFISLRTFFLPFLERECDRLVPRPPLASALAQVRRVGRERERGRGGNKEREQPFLFSIDQKSIRLFRLVARRLLSLFLSLFLSSLVRALEWREVMPLGSSFACRGKKRAEEKKRKRQREKKNDDALFSTSTSSPSTSSHSRE